MTEPAMERTEPYGVEKYFWQILTDSGELEVLNHFYRLEATYQQKEGWRIAVSLIWQISESKDEAMQIIQKLGLCEEKRSESSACDA